MTNNDELLYPTHLKERVLAMSHAALAAYCHGMICDSDGCMNSSEIGYTLCTECLHGGARTAPPIYQLAKQRMKELERA
jgi:hypothetical protein